MDENKEINKNEQNPNSNSKNNKRYKYKNRRKKLADSLQNENDIPKIDQNSNKEISENSENKTEKKKEKKIAIFLQNSQAMKIGKSLLQNV